MASDLGAFYVTLTANASGFLAGAGAAGMAAETLESKIGKGGVALARLGTSVIGAAALVAAYSTKMAVSFDTEMEKLVTQAHRPQAAIDALKGSVINLAKEVGFSPTSLAKALYHPVSAGLALNASMLATKYAAQEARLSGADLEDTIYTLSSAMKTYNVTGSGAKQMMGELNAIVGEGDMRFQDLNLALSTGILPTAKTFGLSLNSVGAALDYMTDRGMPANVSATRLRMAISLLGAPTKQSAGLLADLGLSSTEAASRSKAMAQALAESGLNITTLTSDMRKPNGIMVALMDLKTHMMKAGLTADGAAALITRAFGGGRSGSGIQLLIDNLGGLEQKFNRLQKVGNASSFQKDWDAYTKTLGAQVKITEGNLSALATQLGEKLIPALTATLRWFNGIGKWMKDHKLAAELIGAALAGIAVGAAAVVAIGMVSWLYTTLTAAVTLNGGLVTLVTGFDMLETSLIEVMGVFALAGVAIFLLIKYHKQIWEGIKLVADFIQNVALAVWHEFTSHLKEIGIVIGVLIAGPFVLLGAAVYEIIKHWKGILEFFKELPGKILDALKALPGLLIGFAKTIFHAWLGALNIEIGVIKLFFIDIPKKVLGWIGDLTGTLVHVGKDLMEGLANGIKNNLNPLNAIKNVGGGLINKAKSIFHINSPSLVFAEIGSGIGEGLALGINNSSNMVNTAAEGIADHLTAIGETAGTSSSSSVGTAIDGLQENLSDLGTSLYAVGGPAGNAQGNLDGLNRTTDATASSVSQLETTWSTAWSNISSNTTTAAGEMVTALSSVTEAVSVLKGGLDGTGASWSTFNTQAGSGASALGGSSSGRTNLTTLNGLTYTSGDGLTYSSPNGPDIQFRNPGGASGSIAPNMEAILNNIDTGVAKLNGIDFSQVKSFGGQWSGNRLDEGTFYMNDGTTRQAGRAYTSDELSRIFSTPAPGAGGNSPGQNVVNNNVSPQYNITVPGGGDVSADTMDLIQQAMQQQNQDLLRMLQGI